MEHRIVDMPTFFFIGKLVRTKKSENPSSALGELAKKMTPEVEAELKKLCDLQVKDIVHVTYSTGEDFDDPNGEIVHLIMIYDLKRVKIRPIIHHDESECLGITDAADPSSDSYLFIQIGVSVLK